jgi:hypothetical protein
MTERVRVFGVVASLVGMGLPLTGLAALPPLTAPAGVTAISGRVVGPNGVGLTNIKVADNAQNTQTDSDGRFLLAPAPPGKSVLRIDGRRGGAKHDVDFGVYELRVIAARGRTALLSYTSWLSPIDHSRDVTLPSPTVAEVVVSNPTIPGLEVHIPAGVVIRDVDGSVATQVGITTMPADNAPMPMPHGSRIPTFFAIQPGGGCLYSPTGGIGAAQVRYPNFFKELPGARAVVWRYEPDGVGWHAYGTAAVSDDGRQIVPDKGVLITDFASAECDPATRSHMDVAVRIDSRRLAP